MRGWPQSGQMQPPVRSRGSNEGYPKVPEDLTITEKDPTGAFSWLKAATTAFTFKTLLGHYTKQFVIVKFSRTFIFSSSVVRVPGGGRLGAGPSPLLSPSRASTPDTGHCSLATLPRPSTTTCRLQILTVC